MKKILIIIASIIVLGCNTDKNNLLIKNEYKLNAYEHKPVKLFGNINSIRSNVFEAIEESGLIKKGDMAFGVYDSGDEVNSKNFYNTYNEKGNRVEVVISN